VGAAAVGWRLAKWAAGEGRGLRAAGEVRRWRGKPTAGEVAAGGLGLGFRPTALRAAAVRIALRDCVLRCGLQSAVAGRRLCIRDLGLGRLASSVHCCGLRAAAFVRRAVGPRHCGRLGWAVWALTRSTLPTCRLSS
jgi:hypothetical protein